MGIPRKKNPRNIISIGFYENTPFLKFMRMCDEQFIQLSEIFEKCMRGFQSNLFCSLLDIHYQCSRCHIIISCSSCMITNTYHKFIEKKQRNILSWFGLTLKRFTLFRCKKQKQVLGKELKNNQ